MVAARYPAGFTLLELMVVMAIMASIAVLSGPRLAQLYDTMRYQAAVREVSTSLAATRYQAISRGQPVDLVIDASSGEYGLDGQLDRRLPAGVGLDMLSAGELISQQGQAVFRFYPDGSSSGGQVRLLREIGDTQVGTTIHVDWLLGRISHGAYHAP